MNSPVQKIKERMPIEDVVSSYIKLERSGVNLRARCPFHNEKTPSFFVSPSRGSYYCFGCGAGGDIFSFVQNFEGLDFRGALKLLADKAGVSISNYKGENISSDGKDRLYEIMETATKFFESGLVTRKDVISYLNSRGLNEESIKVFRIGFAKNDWRNLYEHLLKKGFKDSEMEVAGLVKKTEKGFYDRFRGRVIFPIADSSGRVIAFSGRIFEQDFKAEDLDKNAKYLNSPETPIFSKSAVLFGIDKAKDSIRKNNFSILVEGQMDLILSHQAGFRNTVASSGTSLSDSEVSKENVISNLGLVRRLSNNIVLAFDGDSAGFNASVRAGKIALALGMDVKVASMQDGVDPADLIAKQGVTAWKEVIRNSKHLIEFLLDKLIEEHKNDSRKIGREIKDKVLSFVSVLPSSIEKSHFIKVISDKTSIPILALEEDFKKIEKDKKEETVDQKVFSGQPPFSRRDYIEKKLFGILFWQKNSKDATIDTSLLLKELSLILNKKENEILSLPAQVSEDLIFEAEVFYGKDNNLKKDVEELLDNLRTEYLQEELSKKMSELKIAEEKKDLEKSSKILKECQLINEKIQNIKNKKY